MKIIRHVAPDMRQAMRAIREQLGEDAVILSSKRTSAGVEITAAIDFDATALEAQALQSAAPQPPVRPEAPGFHSPQIQPEAPVFNAPLRGGNRPQLEPTSASAQRRQHGPAANAPVSRSLPNRTEVPTFEPPAPQATVHHAPAARAPAAQPSASPTAAWTAVPDTAAPATAAAAAAMVDARADAMGHELKTLRRMLETQLAQLAWNDMTRRAPIHTELLRELTEIGISQDLSEHILKQLPEKADLAYARRFAITGLSQYLLTTGDRWLEDGGRVAFIGATGVGKTTMLAKLAVRWVLRHGPRDVALVASDTVRIGAQDQMQALGQLLGTPVYVPEHFESLPALVSRLERYRLVLIDTPGSSLRDAQLASRLGVLANSSSQFETALVLGASTQVGALEEAVKRFAPANPTCCLLTKVDEAASLGGALSVLIRARLPISYMSEGQRVPEDLKPARALELVSHAVRLAKATGAAADEELLRRRFGKITNALT